MTKLIELIKKQASDRMQLFIYLFLLIIGIFFLFHSFSENSAQAQNTEDVSPDTYIPSGFTLVPLELQNADAISSMIKDYAIVDLYTSNPESKKAIKVGSRLRLLRAPLNPDRFAVLVPYQEASLILATISPISATLLNPEFLGQGKIEKINKKTNRVQYYGGQ